MLYKNIGKFNHSLTHNVQHAYYLFFFLRQVCHYNRRGSRRSREYRESYKTTRFTGNDQFYTTRHWKN